MAPLRLRTRISRACDQCRRRKAKCNGEPNCGACEIYGLRCSYGDAAKRMRGPAYVALLEKKIEHLQDKLKEVQSEETQEEWALSMPAINEPKQDVDAKTVPSVSVTPLDDDTLYDNIYLSGVKVEAGVEIPIAADYAHILSSDTNNISLSPVHPGESASQSSTTSSTPTTWSTEKNPNAKKRPEDTEMTLGPVYDPSSSFWEASLSQTSQQVIGPTAILAPKQMCEIAIDATEGLDPSLAWNDRMITNDTTPLEMRTATPLGEYNARIFETLPDMSPQAMSPAPVRHSLEDTATMLLPQLEKDCQPTSPAVETSNKNVRFPDRWQKVSAEQRTLDYRERNRVAAAKCRAKKLGAAAQLAEDAKSLGIRNASLRQELHDLEAKRSELRSLLDIVVYKTNGEGYNCGG